MNIVFLLNIVYAEIREKFEDLDNNKDLVKYFTMVPAGKDELDSLKDEEWIVPW